MALDGITLRSIVNELKDKLIDGRVQKIYQLNDHIILLNIYNNKENYQLLISSNPQNARIHLTEENYDKPNNPPGFTMVLRKHIQNSKIKEIKQIELDRSVEIIFDSKDELGFNIDKKLMIDIMGKHSNIVLTDDNYKVIESIKRISHEMSSIRAVYPGTTFTKLESDKINILKENSSLNDIEIPENYKINKIFYMFYTGFGPQIGNEIAFRANIDLNLKYGQLNDVQKNNLNNSFLNICEDIRNNNFKNLLYYKDDKPEDFYALLLNYKGDNYKKLDSISKALDLYYKYNVNDNSLNQSRDNLIKIIESIISKSNSKLTNLENDYNNSKEHDKYRIEGDLLSSIAYTVKDRSSEVKVFNYFTNEEDIIKLDVKKDIWANINSKYKKSKKLSKSQKILEKIIPDLKESISYLHSIISQLKNVEEHSEIEEIKDELISQGYIKKSSKRKRKETKSSQPHKFVTNSNNIIYVGKNNKQNEQITLREANPNDVFFHIKDLPGSHVILKSTYEIDDNDIIIASYLAAKYSKNSNDRYIDVDYTEKKNVNKSKGSKPGMVYYTNFQTIRVDLEDEPSGFKKID